MKKIVALMLGLSLTIGVAGLVGCGEKKPTTPAAPTKSADDKPADKANDADKTNDAGEADGNT
jgi:hypothetical protein